MAIVLELARGMSGVRRLWCDWRLTTDRIRFSVLNECPRVQLRFDVQCSDRGFGPHRFPESILPPSRPRNMLFTVVNHVAVSMTVD